MRQLFLLAAALQLFFCVAPQAQEKSSGKQAVRSLSTADWQKRDYLWSAESWNQSDLPYKRLRQKIDDEAKTRIQPDLLMEKYRKASALKPQDPQAVFGWTYAAWLARKRFTDYDSQFRRISKPSKALLATRFPRTLQYARMLFLTQAWQGGSGQILAPVGRQLLARDAKDNDVKYYLAGILSNSQQSKDRQQAVLLTRQLIAANPAKTRYQSRLGDILFASWMLTHSRDDAKQVRDAYEDYLQLKTQDLRLTAHAKRRINYIQVKQPQWDAYRAKNGAASGDPDFIAPPR